MGIHAPHRKEVANRVDAYFIHKVNHRDSFTCTFGHFHFLAILEQAHHLGDKYSQFPRIFANGLHRSLHPRNVAMVVRSPDIDHLIISAFIFIPMICDIRR
ncbi:hypothetical protein D1872_258440 [compost metagenome]